jgi:hypothetical protein
MGAVSTSAAISEIVAPEGSAALADLPVEVLFVL